jgi:metal-sulfur cluster biosynthetic enzyme
MTLVAQWQIEEPQLRITEIDGRTALAAVTGQPVIPARARLRFGPGRTCEPLARLLDRAIVQAEAAGLRPDLLVVAAGRVKRAEDIVRVRRKAHGVADWIHTPTCHVQITLHPAGLHSTAVPPGPASTASAPPAPPIPPAPPALNESTRAVWVALSEVIDPDLGVNVVDLGFVRAVSIEERTAVLIMTLTSAACPLTGILENQIRTELAPLDEIDGFRVDWQWLPAWRPADMTDSGREQLRAIGFTI